MCGRKEQGRDMKGNGWVEEEEKIQTDFCQEFTLRLIGGQSEGIHQGSYQCCMCTLNECDMNVHVLYSICVFICFVYECKNV